MATRRWSFLAPLAIFTFCCAAILIGVLFLLGSPIKAHYLGVLLYFAALTGLIHAWQENGLTTDPKGFVRRFMAALMGKMLLSMVMIMVLLLFAPIAIRVPLALSFAVLYLAFLVFSTLRLFNLAKQPPAP